jgi:hypothetical protein
VCKSLALHTVHTHTHTQTHKQTHRQILTHTHTKRERKREEERKRGKETHTHTHTHYTHTHTQIYDRLTDRQTDVTTDRKASWCGEEYDGMQVISASSVHQIKLNVEDVRRLRGTQAKMQYRT